MSDPVRDRAAQAARDAVARWRSGPDSEYYGAIVDAVAEVLAAEPALRAGDQVQIHDADSRRPASVKLLGNLAGPLVVVPDSAERDALKARVEQLTAALFELTATADRVIHREGNHGVTWMGLLTNKVAESRAVLAEAAK
ncbi:MAG: hypothetical protein JWO11_3588 [Nocardioides sp.]|nr:hypothetical protein [Nocardioides sp.]